MTRDLILAGCLCLISSQAWATEKQLYWGHLVAHEAPTGIERAELMEMQQAHLGNFRRLAEAGDLVLAGPTGDPDSKLRGIVVLRLEDVSGVDALFEPDPFIQRDILKLELFPMGLEQGQLQQGDPADGMENLLLALLAASEGEAVAAALPDRIANHEDLLVHGRLANADAWTDVLVFRTEAPDAVQQQLQQAMPDRDFKAMPFWTGKGSVTKSPPAAVPADVVD